MPTPKEKVLEACFKIAQVNDVPEEIDARWGWIYNKEIMYLEHGDIQYEDYEEVIDSVTFLPLCLEVLNYSIARAKSDAQVNWHYDYINLAEADRATITKARITLTKAKLVLDTYLNVFNSLVKIHGKLGDHQIANAVMIGKREARVRHAMNEAGYSRKVAEIHVAMNK